MASIAKVVVEISLDREFDYRIPASLQASIKVGTQVTVPFHSRELRGFVVGLSNYSAFAGKLKEIAGVVGEKPLIPDPIMKLAYWIADYYCAPIEHAVRTVLPSAVRKRGAKHKKQLTVSLNPAAKRGAAKNVDGASSSVTPVQQDRQACTTELEAPSTLKGKQKLVFEILQAHGSMTLSELKERCGCSDSPIKTLEKNGVVKIEEATIQRDPHAGMELLRTKPFNLMVEQQTALETICASMDREKPQTVLLHGVTGSGKTEVYLQAIQHALDKGQGAIVLVPEIALTPQTVDRFRSRFGECVAVLHSSLSEGERHDEWHRIRNGEAQIAIGARSALFAPIENPGLIVVDEEHEPTYKQDESPRYNARDVAVMRGHLENCCVVLGSATPAMESFANVKSGRYALAEMLLRVDDRSMPHMRVIDMRIEAETEGRPSIFSRELVQAMYDRINKREQVILFLNRRGFSSSLQCERCGYVAECGECSVSMTYHKRAHKLLCHICGAEERVPSRCPDCGDPEFKYAGTGTEKIEEILEKLCPKARVARMDSDTMRKKDSYRTVLDKFRTGKIDILLGTQMIAKGLDFPNVTLVGVLYADMSLNVPDFRAGERTFQLLTQVAGRAGRGEKAGEVIVQAYTPHHPAIQAARNLDYEGFCSQDLEFRKELSYPPFSHLVLLTFKGPSEAEVIAVADDFFERLERILPDSVTHSPPVPAPLARAKGHYRYQIMLRCVHTVRMTKPIRHVIASYKMPKTVTCTVDVDALSLL
jgi:primosomal protein N' (replication factor Y)